MPYYDMHDGSAWWWMLPMMLVFLVVVGVVVWALLNATRSQTPLAPRDPSAEDVLAHRLARGEIDTAEYHERLEALRGHAAAK
ncbi:MAG TPA: SHOCT domain-containing protein [Acidimicrobiia bacterium]|jgi:putative membrane protein|nr:SHOCT domain-containing protein [Acidimicrobiia bacterium]